jgi:hypothetical protein
LTKKYKLFDCVEKGAANKEVNKIKGKMTAPIFIPPTRLLVIRMQSLKLIIELSKSKLQIYFPFPLER